MRLPRLSCQPPNPNPQNPFRTTPTRETAAPGLPLEKKGSGQRLPLVNHSQFGCWRKFTNKPLTTATTLPNCKRRINKVVRVVLLLDVNNTSLMGNCPPHPPSKNYTKVVDVITHAKRGRRVSQARWRRQSNGCRRVCRRRSCLSDTQMHELLPKQSIMYVPFFWCS